MPEFLLRFCDQNCCRRRTTTRQPKRPSAREGGQAEAVASAPLRPQPHKIIAMLPLPRGRAKPGRFAHRPEGPSGGSLKDFSLVKKLLNPERALNTLPKAAASASEKDTQRGQILADATGGKSNRAWATVPRGFGGFASHPLVSYDKQPAREPGCPLHAPHIKARGDPPGLPNRVSLGTSRLAHTVSRRTRKQSPPPLSSKGPTSVVVHGNMEVQRKTGHRLSDVNLLDLADLQPGDLIEIFRFGYQHWAIYVGNGYIVHLAPPTELAGAGCASLMSTLTDKALVKKELLLDVVGKNRYRVNNKHDSKYPPLPITKIVRQAEELVGRELQYKVTSENCEHFVTELRYGVAKSDQVRDALVGVGVAGLGLAALGIIGAVVKRKKQQNQ